MLAALVFTAFSPVLENGFLTLDDPVYVVGNEAVLNGISAQGTLWAFSTFHAANWHPLAWLSHMLDVQLFGLEPSGHHLTSLLLHLANAILLFLALRRATGASGKSFLVSALFAVHPLGVESVAWVAERKNLLTAFFSLAALLAYLRYIRRVSLPWYAATLLLFSCSLLAKPAAITLPFVLLLLDFWPLGRLPGVAGGRGQIGVRSTRFVLLEKAPFLLLSLGSAAVTFVAQQQGGMVKTLSAYPLWVRLGNAPVAYVGYLSKAIFPVDLSAVYGHPGASLPLWGAVLSGVALLLGTAFVTGKARDFPCLPVGWFWYLGTLVPVIGIVQVADQSMADRYTYFPLIGLFVALTWCGAGLTAARDRPWRILAVSTTLLLAVLVSLTVRQAGFWRDDLTLFRHAAEVAPGDYLARMNYGLALARGGVLDRAEAELSVALRIKPDLAIAHHNIGLLMANTHRLSEAVRHFRLSLEIHPDYAEARADLGAALALKGNVAEARAQLLEALRLNPADLRAREHLESLPLPPASGRQ